MERPGFKPSLDDFLSFFDDIIYFIKTSGFDEIVEMQEIYRISNCCIPFLAKYFIKTEIGKSADLIYEMGLEPERNNKIFIALACNKVVSVSDIFVCFIIQVLIHN